MTREEERAYKREYNKRTKFASYKKYEKTMNGFLMRAYRNMKSRVEGIQKKKAHLYEGKELLPKEEFYKWSLKNKDFLDLFTMWEMLEYPRRYTPSIDRKNSKYGYTLGNMQWVPFHVNCSRTKTNLEVAKKRAAIKKQDKILNPIQSNLFA